MVVTILAIAWGAIVAAPLVDVALRTRVVRRVRSLPAPEGDRPARGRTLRLPRAVTVAASVLATPWRRRAARRHDEALRGELPVAIDLLAVAVGAGCTPYAAVEVAARWCPTGMRSALGGVMHDCTLGASFEDALGDAARAAPPLRDLTDAFAVATRLGAPIAPTLARLAGEHRADLRRRAEARARTVPVRLLFPLVFLVLPAFGLLTVAPVLLDGLARAR